MASEPVEGDYPDEQGQAQRDAAAWRALVAVFHEIDPEGKSVDDPDSRAQIRDAIALVMRERNDLLDGFKRQQGLTKARAAEVEELRAENAKLEELKGRTEAAETECRRLHREVERLNELLGDEDEASNRNAAKRLRRAHFALIEAGCTSGDLDWCLMQACGAIGYRRAAEPQFFAKLKGTAD